MLAVESLQFLNTKLRQVIAEQGEISLSTGLAYKELASAYELEYQYRDAQSCLHKALDIFQQLPKEIYWVQMTFFQLANLCLYSTENYRAAEEYLNQALDSSNAAGEKPLAQEWIYSFMLVLYSRLKDFPKLKAAYSKIIELTQKKLGGPSPQLAHEHLCLANLAYAYKAYDDALENYIQARNIYMQVFPKGDDKIDDLNLILIQFCSILAFRFEYDFDHANAEIFYKKQLDFGKTYYGEPAAQNAEVYLDLGNMYLGIRRWNDAFACFEQAFKLYSDLNHERGMWIAKHMLERGIDLQNVTYNT